MIQDPGQRIVNRNSVLFALSALSTLQLPCPSAGNAVLTQADIDDLVAQLFVGGQQQIPMDAFGSLVMQKSTISNSFKILLDGFGLFPYFFYEYIQDNVETMSRQNFNQLKSATPHKEGFLFKTYPGTFGKDTVQKHWVVVENRFLYYYAMNNAYDEVLKSIYLGECGCGPIQGRHATFQVSTSAGHIKTFTCENEEIMNEWISVIKYYSPLIANSPKNANASFSPARDRVSARWFIDGIEAFKLIGDALNRAQSEIYITDWFLSPQVSLFYFLFLIYFYFIYFPIILSTLNFFHYLFLYFLYFGYHLKFFLFFQIIIL